MKENWQIIWAQRKLNPRREVRPDKLVQCTNFFSPTSSITCLCVNDPTEPLGFSDLWSTLHLVWGRFANYMALVAVNSLKEPQRSVPKKM